LHGATLRLSSRAEVSHAGCVPIDVDEETFGRLVEEALDSIPPELGRLMRNVAVVVEDEGASPNLLGLYHGVPLTNRNPTSYAGVLPDRISIYRLPIVRRCETPEEVARQVRITVIHEVAHHFGIDDERLHELGWA
jgi:predicted Zn-dependent protease with MMP-like domain